MADWARDQMSFEFISREMLVEYVHRGYDPYFNGCKMAKKLILAGKASVTMHGQESRA